MMTPSDHMSHDLSYFSGPKTSGAAIENIFPGLCNLFHYGFYPQQISKSSKMRRTKFYNCHK